jgi:hypothetical protein
VPLQTSANQPPSPGDIAVLHSRYTSRGEDPAGANKLHGRRLAARRMRPQHPVPFGAHRLH